MANMGAGSSPSMLSKLHALVADDDPDIAITETDLLSWYILRSYLTRSDTLAIKVRSAQTNIAVVVLNSCSPELAPNVKTIPNLHTRSNSD